MTEDFLAKDSKEAKPKAKVIDILGVLCPMCGAPRGRAFIIETCEQPVCQRCAVSLRPFDTEAAS